MKSALFFLLMMFIPIAAVSADEGSRSIVVVPSGRGDVRVIAGGKARVERVLDCEGEAAGCPYLGVFTGQPGLEVAEHRHDDSEEWLYVLAGNGILTSQGRTVPLSAGDTVRIPRGVPHAFKVPMDSAHPDRPIPDFEAIQVFPQGGPQSRFRSAPPAPATP